RPWLHHPPGSQGRQRCRDRGGSGRDRRSSRWLCRSRGAGPDHWICPRLRSEGSRCWQFHKEYVPQTETGVSMRKQMRICFMIQGFGDGGAQKQCIYLLNELQQRVGVELFLIRFHDGQVHDSLLEIGNLTVYTIQTSSNYDPRNIARAYRLIRCLSPDILMSWLPCCDVYAGFIR